MRYWITAFAALSALSIAAWASPSSTPVQREKRICQAMKADAELNSLSKELLQELETVSPGLTAPEQDTTRLIHQLPAQDADRVAAVTCKWIEGISSRLSKIDPIFADLDALTSDETGNEAASELALATADGDLDGMFCSRSSELGRTPLPQDPTLTYSDYTVGILIGRIRDQAENGDALTSDLWSAFGRGYGVTAGTCR